MFCSNFVKPNGVGMGGKVGVSGGEDIWIEAFERRRGENDGEEGDALEGMSGLEVGGKLFWF